MIAVRDHSSRFLRDAGCRRVDRRFRSIRDGRDDDDDVGVDVGHRAKSEDDLPVADVRREKTQKR